jgi:hypothetical protein
MLQLRRKTKSEPYKPLVELQLKETEALFAARCEGTKLVGERRGNATNAATYHAYRLWCNSIKILHISFVSNPLGLAR